MTVLKRKKSTQWEKAQQRINVSPIASRISRLVPEGKAAAVGLAFEEKEEHTMGESSTED